MTPEKLLDTIERNGIKPLEMWNKLPYSAQILYCQRAIESGSWINILLCGEVSSEDVEKELKKLVA